MVTLNYRCRIIVGTQKGTMILTTTQRAPPVNGSFACFEAVKVITRFSNPLDSLAYIRPRPHGKTATTTTTTRKHLRLPPRAVCLCAQRPENLEFCVVFVKKTMFGVLVHSNLVLFVGEVVANTMLFVFYFAVFWGLLRSFCLESLENTSILFIGGVLKSSATTGSNIVSVIHCYHRRYRHRHCYLPHKQSTSCKNNINIINTPPSPPPHQCTQQKEKQYM